MKGLSSAGKISLDANIILYYLHQDKNFGKQSFRLLTAVKNKTKIISTLIYAESFVYVFEQADESLEKKQLKALEKIPKLKIVAPTKKICLLAAQLRAAYRLKTPDAIHLATAIDSDCDIFITNDDNLKKVQEINVLTLADL